MTLFTPDLFRNFAIGFALGGLVVGATTMGEWGGTLESPAQAAQPYEAPPQSPEFMIEPLEIEE